MNHQQRASELRRPGQNLDEVGTRGEETLVTEVRDEAQNVLKVERGEKLGLVGIESEAAACDCVIVLGTFRNQDEHVQIRDLDLRKLEFAHCFLRADFDETRGRE